MQCNAMQCNAMQCNAMQCNAMEYNTMQCNAMEYNTIQHNTCRGSPYTSCSPWRSPSVRNSPRRHTPVDTIHIKLTFIAPNPQGHELSGTPKRSPNQHQVDFKNSRQILRDTSSVARQNRVLINIKSIFRIKFVNW